MYLQEALLCLFLLGEKPFECNECGRRFARSTDLKVHMPVHSEDKPYKCGECEKMFTRFSTLKEHIRTHTGNRLRAVSYFSFIFARGAFGEAASNQGGARAKKKSRLLLIVNLHNFTFLRAARGFEERRTEVIKKSICAMKRGFLDSVANCL